MNMFQTTEGIFSFAFGLAVILLGDFILFHFLHRRFVWIGVLLLEATFVVASLFAMPFLAECCLAAFVIFVVASLFANLSEYRLFLSNAFKGKANIGFFSHKDKVPVLVPHFDRDEVYGKVYTAVVDMSRLKRGALITFEKKDNILDDSKIGTIIKQRGVDVNAPVSAELLETIFYEGTRLHDGAVIIKDDKIARAAVFFASTARPLTGKYGSRHQAAIGISENSDSVTVVVSEETGRISIAFQGELTPVTPDNFLRVFEDDMAYEAEPSDGADKTPNDDQGE